MQVYMYVCIYVLFMLLSPKGFYHQRATSMLPHPKPTLKKYSSHRSTPKKACRSPEMFDNNVARDSEGFVVVDLLQQPIYYK